MKKRTLVLALAAVAACVAVAVMMRGGGNDTAATASSAAPRVDTAQRTTPRAAVQAPSLAGAPAVVHADGEAIKDDTEYPVDPTPPTHEEPLTEAQRDPRMKRAVELLDQAVVRAEARLAAAEAAGDKAAATTARVRIKRLREVREKRATEPEATP